MIDITVEYLVVINKSDAFCDDAASFNRLLQVNPSISIKKGDIHFLDAFTCGYQITSGEVPDRDQLYFHLKFDKAFGGEPSNDDIDQFLAFLKTIREVISKAGGQATTLWDDISYYFSQKAYSVIYEIENLMRKLITNFMLVKVGKDWASETSPSEVKEAFNKNKRNDYANVLHSVDFNDLANFLLKSYSNKSPQELYVRLQSAKTVEDLAELKEFIPASNWKRYFSSLVKCEDSYLQKRWTELYELRCKVAHNAIITRKDFQDIVRLVDELRPELTDAISKLPQVSMPLEEREFVAENAAGNLSTLYGSFILAWRIIENHINDLLGDLELGRQNSTQALDSLFVQGAISEKHHNRLHWLRRFRNTIVHNAGAELPEENVRACITEVYEIIEELGLAGHTAVIAVAGMLRKAYPDATLRIQEDNPNIFLEQGNSIISVGVEFVPIVNPRVAANIYTSLNIGEGLVAQKNVDKFVLVIVGARKTIAKILVDLFCDKATELVSEIWVGYLNDGVFTLVTNEHLSQPLFDRN